MDFAYFTSPLFMEHKTGEHPENPQRLTAINGEVEKLIPRDLWIEPGDATVGQIAAVHTSAHIDLVRNECESGSASLDLDTPISPKSYASAVKAAGAGVEAVDGVLAGKFKRAFLAVRPPGHHAEADRAMGFCLFNNIAVAARHAQKKGIDRLAIVDFDVHHGNGTQHSFYHDPGLLFISLHHWGIYPGTGSSEERGGKGAVGTTVNYPLPSYSGDDRYLSTFRDSLIPTLEDFKPELLLISAGFDAHIDDPLGGMSLTDEGFGGMTEMLVDSAENFCGGRVVSFLEGGYNLQKLGKTVAVHIGALMREPG
jgi:acetoin utilization deacetylase AcuC-like enzyme